VAVPGSVYAAVVPVQPTTIYSSARVLHDEPNDTHYADILGSEGLNRMNSGMAAGIVPRASYGKISAM
jgi:hypothetical protein